VFLDDDAAAVAAGAGLDMAVRGAGAGACIADLLFFEAEWDFAASVEVAEGDGELDFHFVAAADAGLLTAAAAEELGEEVEGVVLLLAACAFVVCEAVVAVLVVDLAGCRVREGFVGFSYFEELLFIAG